MPVAATWMNLEIITVNEVRKKDKYHVLSFIYGIENMTQGTSLVIQWLQWDTFTAMIPGSVLSQETKISQAA